MRARLPDNERERLEALRQYRILDTIPEPSFDDIVHLAAEICGTPIAAISLIDEHRQWFKSIVGLDARETSRDVAFCAHAILAPDQVLLVEDATLDERFADNDLVRHDPGIRFYAGTPLVSTTGHALGTLCVIDQAPRGLLPGQRRALEILGREVVSQLELRRAVGDLEKTIVGLKQAEAELEQNRRQQLELKDRFISHVSHELRSPLTVVYQFLTLLLDGLAGDITEQQKEYLGIALRNAEELKDMIGDLLEVTRAQTGRLTIEQSRIDLAPIIEDVVRSTQPVAKEKGITLGTESGGEIPEIVADARRIRQVVVNLVENAIKFTPPGGSITIQTELDETDADFVRVTVRDTGCGLEPADRNRVFNYMYQVPGSSDSQRKGLGLGLYICKELVSRHGGRIWAGSEQGAGSRFSFTVPAFALPRILQPVLTPANLVRGSIAVVAVRLFVADPAAGAGRPADPLQPAWELVQACTNPALDVVLPRFSGGRSGETFVILAMAGEQGVRALTERIEDQLARRAAVREAGYDWKIETTLLAIPALAPESTEESIAARLAQMLDPHLQETGLRRAA